MRHTYLEVRATRLARTVAGDPNRQMTLYRSGVDRLEHSATAFIVLEYELPDYYRASDIVVSMAGSEGFPNTLLEAMGCEAPILVGDIPQVRELLKNGINARICGIDKMKIADVLGEMLNDPVGTRDMAAKGRETVRHFGDINTNGRRFSDEIKRHWKKNT